MPLLEKKRPTRGWRKEWKIIWAPLFFVSTTWIGWQSLIYSHSLGLGKSHPEDKDELENVVEGWFRVSLLICKVAAQLNVRNQ